MKKYTFLAMVLIVIFGALYMYVIGIKKIQTWVSTRDSKNYTVKMYNDYTLIGSSCQGEDTDGDSYVSCDLRIKNASSVDRVLHLQCPTMLKSFTGSVCKEYRFAIPQQ